MNEAAREKTIKAEILAEAKKKAIGWGLSSAATLLVVAATGWWLFLEPKIIKRFGGVPQGAIVAFEDKCPDVENWLPFEPSKGRTLIGSGGKVHFDVGSATESESDIVPGSTGSTRLRSSVRTLPVFSGATPPARLPYPNENVDPTAMYMLVTRNTQVIKLPLPPDNAIQYSILPPFIAVTFCKKR